MANTCVNPAIEYQKLIDEFLELRERAQAVILDENKYDEGLVDKIEEIQNKMIAFNKKYMESPHFVLPDPETEFTKH